MQKKRLRIGEAFCLTKSHGGNGPLTAGGGRASPIGVNTPMLLDLMMDLTKQKEMRGLWTSDDCDEKINRR